MPRVRGGSKRTAGTYHAGCAGAPVLSFPTLALSLAPRSRPLLVSVALFALSGLTPGCQGKAPTQGEDATEAKAAPLVQRTATADSHGYGEGKIAWRELDEGMAESAKDGKPLMLLVHASWCSRCKALKPEFNGNTELAELSNRFIMVNADQDQVPAVLGYAPDGTYIPRILFISPVTGEVDEALRNPRRDKYRYFYTPTDDLVGMMKKALEQYGSS